MPRPKSGPEPSVCACGRKLADAASYVHRSAVAVYVYRRCDCGVEWTERRLSIDRSQPVTTDEVIEVHRFLSSFEGPLPHLIGTEQQPPAPQQ